MLKPVIVFLSFLLLFKLGETNNAVNFQRLFEHGFHPRQLLRRGIQSEDSCLSPDIFIAIDRSYLNDRNFAKTTEPVLRLISEAVKNCDARVSVVEFGSNTKVTVRLTDSQSTSFSQQLNQFQLGPDSSLKALLAPALDAIISQMTTVKRPDRGSLPVEAIVFLLVGNDPVDVANAMEKIAELRKYRAVPVVLKFSSATVQLASHGSVLTVQVPENIDEVVNAIVKVSKLLCQYQDESLTSPSAAPLVGNIEDNTDNLPPLQSSRMLLSDSDDETLPTFPVASPTPAKPTTASSIFPAITQWDFNPDETAGELKPDSSSLETTTLQTRKVPSTTTTASSTITLWDFMPDETVGGLKPYLPPQTAPETRKTPTPKSTTSTTATKPSTAAIKVIPTRKVVPTAAPFKPTIEDVQQVTESSTRATTTLSPSSTRVTPPVEVITTTTPTTTLPPTTSKSTRQTTVQPIKVVEVTSSLPTTTIQPSTVVTTRVESTSPSTSTESGEPTTTPFLLKIARPTQRSFRLPDLMSSPLKAPIEIPEASKYCLTCLSHRNNKDLYANPADCHTYYQCAYYGLNGAIATLRQCPHGMYWQDKILSCVPEGPIACIDLCQNDTVAAHGCYGVADDCAKFFTCSNMVSHSQCCPSGTRFNEAICTCVFDRECVSDCMFSYYKPVAPLALPHSDGTTCVDAYGNLMRRSPTGNGEVFELIDSSIPSFPRFVAIPCAPGSLFDITACRCEKPASLESYPEIKPDNQQCHLYMPFDSDYQDHSRNKFKAYKYGLVNFVSGQSAVGNGGSIRFQNGTIEIPGLKTIDLQDRASWCFFFRCENSDGSFSCLRSGGILSNNNNAEECGHSILIGAMEGNTIVAKVNLRQPENAVTATGTDFKSSQSGWVHVCVVYDGTFVKVYANGRAGITAVPTSGRLAISHCPYVIGADQLFGSFTGSVDELLLCGHAMTSDEIKAHYEGNRNYLVTKGLIPKQI